MLFAPKTYAVFHPMLEQPLLFPIESNSIKTARSLCKFSFEVYVWVENMRERNPWTIIPTLLSASYTPYSHIQFTHSKSITIKRTGEKGCIHNLEWWGIKAWVEKDWQSLPRRVLNEFLNWIWIIFQKRKSSRKISNSLEEFYFQLSSDVFFF